MYTDEKKNNDIQSEVCCKTGGKRDKRTVLSFNVNDKDISRQWITHGEARSFGDSFVKSQQHHWDDVDGIAG